MRSSATCVTRSAACSTPARPTSSAASSAAWSGARRPDMAYLLSQLLTDSARDMPDNEAISMAGRNLSYRELDEASNRLARLLVETGVGRGDRVALYLDKSVESYIAIHAVLKADAAY